MFAAAPVRGTRTGGRTFPMVKSGKPARVISVSSGKGGVGKTLTTVNLGLALFKLGKRVLLLDADLGLANINIMLGFKPAATLHDVLSGTADVRDIVVNHRSGLDIIPAASGIPEMTQLSEEERLHMVTSFDGFAEEYDYMIIDTAAGIGQNVLHFNVAAEQCIIVIGPEPTSITDAYALIKVLTTDWNAKEFDILVNRAPLGTDGRSIYAKLAAATDKFLPVRLNYLGSIADDDSAGEAIMRQTPLLELYPSSRASRDINRLAKKVAANEGSRTPKGGLQFFFRALLEQNQG